MPSQRTGGGVAPHIGEGSSNETSGLIMMSPRSQPGVPEGTLVPGWAHGSAQMCHPWCQRWEPLSAVGSGSQLQFHSDSQH